MASRPARRVRAALHFGFLAALLALVGQLALGAAVVPDDATAGQLAALDAISVLCVGQPPPGHGDPAPHRHHAADLAVCPLSLALAIPAVLPPSSPALPAPPTALVLRRGEWPPGRGPPLPSARVGVPRAPPSLA